MIKYCIYKFTSPSGKAYIGQTSDLRRRIKDHKKPSSGCCAFSNAIKKYGIDSFVCEIIKDDLTINEANYWEEMLIDTHKTLWPNGYNLNTGGKNHTASEETKRRMSIARKGKGIGRIISEETRKKISEGNKGKKRTEETRRRLSEISSGMSSETREKIAKKLRGAKLSPERVKKAALARVGLKRGVDTRAKMSESAKGKVFSESHKKALSEARKGTLYFNNGIVNVRAFECPDGFVVGKITEKSGIYYVEERGKWRGRLCVNGNKIHLGYFKTREEALNERENVLKKIHASANQPMELPKAGKVELCLACQIPGSRIKGKN